ncbi:C6 transcription factor [Pseudozyma hubeiensis SY62]|uniref:C6 transcription factor n=1 Tax=Pseudozyma hubeiensis (strain SY62) TaxID=1305764 RepID=R9PDS2_PSEHS|nr:C6 transcription factor [Pseudozyma hubeiensis SY62]GAC96240.1 C6 transcription factor [Pseudozyma hubeiensis SY62]
MTNHPQRRSVSTTPVSSGSSSLQVDLSRRSNSPSATCPSQNKAYGACSSCRRSKVKCDHDGMAPCKRCRNGGYECIFKTKELGSALQQDEWRARTDETLTKLVSVMTALVEQGETVPQKRRRVALQDWSDDNIVPFAPCRSTAVTPSRIQQTRDVLPLPSRATPHDTCQLGPVAGHSSVTGTLAPVATRVASENGSNHRYLSNYATSGYATELLRQGKCAASSSTSSCNGTYDPITLSKNHGSSMPLPKISLDRNIVSLQSQPKPALPLRASRYRYPDASLGSNDPRLDAIRLGLLSSHEARHLFSSYAKHIEPFGFGFPDFPASSELTPVLLSAITSVASILSPSSEVRSCQPRLQADVLDRTLPYAPSTAEDEFNPESGIGTEEVVGACIWATYNGSMEAWNVARAARWWSEKYSYETGPHAGLTVGEMVAILPPVRHVSIQDRVRVWLTAFLTELHQSEIHGKEPIMQLIDPAQYGQALMVDESGGSMSKQDSALIFYSRVAYLVATAKKLINAEEMVEATRQITASWCTTRALLATDPDMKDSYDHSIDLHYSLAKASVLIGACQILEEGIAKHTTRAAIDVATIAYVSATQLCQSACIDGLRWLLSSKSGFVGSLAALPSIHHFWIAQCAVFLLGLCRTDGLHYRHGLLVAGHLQDILATVGGFMQQYVAELSACSTVIFVGEGVGGEGVHNVVKHPALDAALSVADVLASIQATV